MNQVEELVPMLRTLRETKGKMIALAGKLASDEHWDRAQKVLAWARSLGEIIGQMDSGVGPATIERAEPRLSRLPYFYIDRDEKLVMQARSRGGGSYKHRVVKPHYDLVVRKLVDIARKSRNFYSQDLQDRREMPVHEPLLIMRLLASKGLITKMQKGKYTFADAGHFEDEAIALWSQLPREVER